MNILVQNIIIRIYDNIYKIHYLLLTGYRLNLPDFTAERSFRMSGNKYPNDEIDIDLQIVPEQEGCDSRCVRA